MACSAVGQARWPLIWAGATSGEDLGPNTSLWQLSEEQRGPDLRGVTARPFGIQGPGAMGSRGPATRQEQGQRGSSALPRRGVVRRRAVLGRHTAGAMARRSAPRCADARRPVAFMADAQLCCPFTAGAPQRRHLAAQELAVPVPHRRHELLARAGDRCVWRRAPGCRRRARVARKRAASACAAATSPLSKLQPPSTRSGRRPDAAPPPLQARGASRLRTPRRSSSCWSGATGRAPPWSSKSWAASSTPNFMRWVSSTASTAETGSSRSGGSDASGGGRQRRQLPRAAAAASSTCVAVHARRRERHTPGPLAASPKAARAHTRTHQHTNTPTFHTPPCRLCATWARPRACR